MVAYELWPQLTGCAPVAARAHQGAAVAVVRRHDGAVDAVAPRGAAGHAAAHGLLRLQPPRYCAAGVDRRRFDPRRAAARDLGVHPRLHPCQRPPAGRDRAREPFTFSATAHPVTHTPVALNRFGLWVAMMIGLTLVNYGFPIAQLASLEGRVGARHPDREPVMARAERCTAGATRGSAGASSALVVLTVLAILVGFVLLPSVHGDFTAQGPVGEHLPRGGRSRVLGRRRRDVKEAPHADRCRARTRPWRSSGANDAVGRGATLALNCTMCHGAQGLSVSNAPNLAGQYPEVVIKQLQRLQDGQAHERRHGGAGQEPVASRTSRDWPPTTRTCRRRELRRRPTTKRCRPSSAWVTRCATSRPASPATAASTRSSVRLGSKACPRSTSSPSCCLQGRHRRNDSQAQMRNMVRPMTEAKSTRWPPSTRARPAPARRDEARPDSSQAATPQLGAQLGPTHAHQ